MHAPSDATPCDEAVESATLAALCAAHALSTLNQPLNTNTRDDTHDSEV